MNRRAQVEMIGVVIIVILIVCAMLFYIIYKINNPEQNIKRSYMNKELATSLLLSMTKSSVKECPTHTLGELITDCANSPNYRIFCQGVGSCDKAREVIGLILNNPAISEMGKNFTLSIEEAGITFVNSCAPNKEKIQGFQVLTIYPSSRQVELLLDVCDS